MGRLVAGVGEANVSDLIPWLVDKVQSQTSAVDRSGGAQGLSEVLAAVGEPLLSTVLGQILHLSKSSEPAPREGLHWFLAFLPQSLGKEFTRHISMCLPVVIRGLADEREAVRDVALRAGSVIVQNYADKDAGEVLPPLEEALHDPEWRIRQNAIKLIGELLYR